MRRRLDKSSEVCSPKEVPYKKDAEKWALLLLKDAKQSPHTRNAVTFQLTKSSVTRREENTIPSLPSHTTHIFAITMAIEEYHGSKGIDRCMEVLAVVTARTSELEVKATAVVK